MQSVPIQISRVKALSISWIPCSITCSKFFNDSTLLLEWTPSSLLWLSQLWPVPLQGLSSLMAGVLQLCHLGINLSASWIVSSRWTPPHVALSCHGLLQKLVLRKRGCQVFMRVAYTCWKSQQPSSDCTWSPCGEPSHALPTHWGEAEIWPSLDSWLAMQGETCFSLG